MTTLKVWKYQYPYPINNWRDKESYKEKRTSKEWAWEFLRRNEHYQYDYDRYIHNQDFSEYRIVIEDEMTLERQKSLIEEMKYHGIDTDDNIDAHSKSFSVNALSTRSVKEDGYKYPLKIAILKKYRLFPCRLHNPKEALPENNFFDADRDGIETLYYNPNPKGDRFKIAPVKPEHIVFRLNARVSLNRQLAHITKCLENTKKHLDIPKIKNKPSDSALTNYIRTLDVVASGDIGIVPLNEIVNAIHNKGESTQRADQYFYDDWLPKGLELSDTGYFYLFDK